MPKECTIKNALAWEIWNLLDKHGRGIDTMAGNPLPLRLDIVNAECSRYGDPDGLRWRVLEIDKQIVKYRREHMKK